MREYYKEHCYSAIYPSRIMHNMGVSGKISGAMNVVSEIKEAIPIIHSPKGCGFHYKYIARRKYLPLYKAQCSNLEEEDIIFGTEKKLKKAISETLDNYQPKLIVIIPSVCTDILDIEIDKNIIDEFKKKTDCKIVFIKSEVFSHIDKLSSKKFKRERIVHWKEPEKQGGIDKGCGVDEAMSAFVEQLMEKQQVQDRTVNIESFAWGGNENLKEIISVLQNIGIKVNTVIPSCSVEDIITAPRAKLNIVRRVSWAKKMKMTFGTEYLHVNTFQPYHGLKGIEKFYMSIAQYFDLNSEARKVLKDMKRQIFIEINEAKNYIGEHTFALYSDSFLSLPYIIEALTNDYGVNLKYICIDIDNNKLEYEDVDVDKDILEDTMMNIKKIINNTGNNTIIYINSKKNDLKEIFENVDIVINGTKFLGPFKGLKTVDLGKMFIPIDFNNFKKNVYDFASKVRKAKSQENLIISKFDYDNLLYPTVWEKGPITSEKMWNKMWNLRR